MNRFTRCLGVPDLRFPLVFLVDEPKAHESVPPHILLFIANSRKSVGLSNDPPVKGPEYPSTSRQFLGIHIPNVIALTLCLFPISVEPRYEVLSPQICLDLLARHCLLGDATIQQLRLSVMFSQPTLTSS
jgi:hypothetical protein